MKVSISSINDIYKFVELAQSVEGDIVVRKGKFCVDGRSALGVLSLNLTSGATIEFAPTPSNQFMIDYLEQFEVK